MPGNVYLSALPLECLLNKFSVSSLHFARLLEVGGRGMFSCWVFLSGLLGGVRYKYFKLLIFFSLVGTGVSVAVLLLLASLFIK